MYLTVNELRTLHFFFFLQSSFYNFDSLITMSLYYFPEVKVHGTRIVLYIIIGKGLID